MTRKIAITGLPGTGKSTIARLFGDLGAAVFDADAVVRELYAPGGAAAELVTARWPQTRAAHGGVDAAALRALVRDTPAVLEELEAIVHPLVVQARHDFVRRSRAAGAALAVMEIPLLFETAAERDVDVVVLADAPEDVRLARLRQRPGFDEALLEVLQARQLPLAEKRRRADIVIDTGGTLQETAAQVRAAFARLREG